MKTYKGFDKDLKCRGFQYEVGGEYEEESAKICEKGFHACEYPLDVFSYYAPVDSRFCEVEQSGDIARAGDDSKVVSRKIKVVAETGLDGLIKAGVKFILDRVRWKDSAATNTGDQSAATNTGNRSAATNTGHRSAATNTGHQSAATNTGHQSAATNTGHRSAATNTGYQSAATNTGYRSAATNTGNQSAATVKKGGSVAVVTGAKSKAKAGLGSAIVVCDRGEWNGEDYPLLDIKAAIIDGQTLKPDTFYMLVNGEFAEAENQ